MPPYCKMVETSFLVNGERCNYLAADQYGWGSEFGRIEWIPEEPDIRRGMLGKADAFLIDTRALLAAALFHMRDDPYSFVTDISPWL